MENMEETFRKYELMNKKYADERFLLRTPYPIITINLLYIFLVLFFVPKYMKDKKPFVLKNTILVYNALQIFANFYVLFEGLPLLFLYKVDLSCPLANDELLAFGYYYFLLKIFDLVETIFFALKKKNNQISFLHVYHHVLMVSLSYISGVSFKASGQATVIVTVNCCVHFVMYIYYFLSAYSPGSNLLRLKKFITQVQLTQFVIFLLQNLYPLYFEHCYMTMPFILLGISQALLMIFLFGKFYIDNYLLEKIKK